MELVITRIPTAMEEFLRKSIVVLMTSYVFIYYFFFLFCFVLSHQSQRPNRKTYTGGISIIIPCFDEVLIVKNTIESVLNCKRDFDIELIIVDDGIKSETYDFLVNEYRPTSSDRFTIQSIHTKSIKNTASTVINNVPCLIIDKINGGKADALNTGINFATYEYFLCLDGDSILDEKALINLYEAIEDGTLAIGGRVQPIVSQGLTRLEKMYTIAQVYEYARTFSIVRAAYGSVHAVPLLSGAISLFHTNTVRTLGGYNTQTKGEDFELTLRLQEYDINKGRSIKYLSSALVYTQVPFDIKSIFKQRTRWQQGMYETLKIHSTLRKAPNRMGLALNHMALYEKYSCLIDLILIFTDPNYFCFFAGISMVLGFIFSYYVSYKNKTSQYNNIFALTIFGIFFHYLNNIIRLSCLFRKNTKTWGSPKRMMIRI